LRKAKFSEMAANPDISLIDYLPPVKVTPNEEKSSTDSPKLKPALTPIEKKIAEILPPREYEQNGQKFLQLVSPRQATRNAILTKEKLLDSRLEEAEARERGICLARREIYSELMDELIRQIAISSTETGALLVQIRDEINMTLAGYETIVESANGFGSRKALQSELGKEEKHSEVQELQDEVDSFKKQIQVLKVNLETVSRREQEEKDALIRRQQEELQFLKRNNQQLKAQVDSIQSSRK